MPLEIPGEMLREIPDKTSMGVCRRCRRPYFKLKIRKISKNKVVLICPFCAFVIKEPPNAS